jgi:hypothetical protein
MERGEKRVDGFRFLPPGLRAWIRSFIPQGHFTGPIPWTPLPSRYGRRRWGWSPVPESV